ncbi:tyrosine-protein kinase Wzc [Aquipluma nitroreducens]|uniref:non-specific protein-tyrosine kinase n=1 Tax=Aquipluma nitroreducens TaxID=2010828 RepID=A0A5K7S3T0_9BACT|nr:tyrosine-protein kinase [Aquipluma nitroreducens]BBE16203.1 tyrosine-protein kinase Wzc [Aquipluma nitroreducens]
MENIDNIYEVLKEEDGPDIKKIIYLLLRQWHWFLLFGALGFGGAYSYTRLTKPTYSVSGSILIPEKSNEMDLKDLFSGALQGGQDNTKINNQIEILKSSFTINHTLLNLNWRTSWYKKDLFIWNGIYKQEPFDVQETQSFINPSGIKIYITPTSQNSYLVSGVGELNVQGKIYIVKFNSKGEFGHPFRNEYFNFTILKKINISDIPDGKYYFVFNDQREMTLAYQIRLDATLKDEKSDIVLCTIKGEEPEKESDFLNELIKVYIRQKMEVQNEAQRRSLDFINTQLAGISDSLDRAGTKSTEFRSRNDIIDLGAEGTLVMNTLKEVESEKAQTQMQLDYFRNVLDYLEKNGDLTKLVSPSVVGIEDASLNALVVNLGELFSRRQVLSFTARANNPTLILLDKELAQARTRLNENIRNLIDNANRSINSLKDRQDKIILQLNKLPQKEQQMINIQRQFDLTNEIYTFMLQKRAETNIALASSISDVQIIESASPDTALSVGLTRKTILPIGFILGLSLPAGFILLVNFFDTRIRTQEDIENNTQLPIIGNIMHSFDANELTVFGNPKSNIAESFRDLRTNLEFMLSGTQAKVISIHSTNPSEGKTFNTTNLATILAMNDNKVLIIGADMRKPKLHRIFKVENEHGLSTCLIGADTFEQVIFPTQIENLYLLPSGPVPPNPAEILSKPAMKNLIEMARNQFDYVLIDNSPVALVTDGIIASRVSDLNIFILRYGVSHKHQLEMINQYAETKKVTNIGIIVNDIKVNSFGYTYYKYYQYEAYQKDYYAYGEDGVEKRRKKKVKKA